MSASLQVIGSSSAANGYILTCGNEKLIIEAGCKPKEYLSVLSYDIKNAYCIVSHCHSDHCRNLNKILSYGIPAYAPPSVCEIHPKCKCVEHLHKYKIGGFTIMPLSVEHNVECFGYIIEHKDMGRLVFATDLKSFPYKIPDVSCLMLECNYCDETVIDNLCNGADIHSRPDNHLSLEKALETARRLYSPKLSKVILLHLSDGNSNEDLIKRRFKDELGIDVFIAESGLTVDLKEDDF